MRTMLRSPGLLIGSALMAALFVLAVVAEPIWGDTAERTTLDSHLPASAAHWFGTDALGRVVFARTMVATRLTLLMTLSAAAIAAFLGVALGSLIWITGPRIREIGQRLIDIMVSYPAVIFALVVSAVLGPSPTTSVLAIGLATSPAFARLTTNLVAQIASRDYVPVARQLGVGPLRMLRRHILPNVAEPLLILCSVAFTVALKALSGLSFLGLGVQAPDYDWGRLLFTGLEGIYVNPAPALGPALAIVLAGVAGGFIGDGLAAAAGLEARSPFRKRRAKLSAPSEVDQSEALVAVENLSIHAGDRVLVDGVSLRIGHGEILGVVGESGSGKSLTAMAIAQLLPDGVTHTAEVLRAGSGSTDPKRLALEIGLVYQDPMASLNPTLRVGGQLTEVLTVHGGVSRREARKRAVDALAQVRVTLPEQRVKQRPHELSGGMRQRAMIAAALLTKPKLLIADEPTTALDVTVQAEVLGILREANAAGAGVLFISHDIAVVAALCHRVLVMQSGRIVEELSIADLRAGRAQHPYTRKLLGAALTLEDARA